MFNLMLDVGLMILPKISVLQCICDTFLYTYTAYLNKDMIRLNHYHHKYYCYDMSSSIFQNTNYFCHRYYHHHHHHLLHLHHLHHHNHHLHNLQIIISDIGFSPFAPLKTPSQGCLIDLGSTELSQICWICSEIWI